MINQAIKKIVIVGGGTAGWMAAASLSHFLKHRAVEIILIESAEIGTIGVGEATLPGLRDFNYSLGIDEIDFIKETQATFKLGIEFNDWKIKGSSFFHPFSHYGMSIEGLEFHQVWQTLYKQNKASDLSHYCLSSILAKNNKFVQPNPKTTSPLAQYHYAYHFDASLYAKYLRNFSVKLGVTRIESTITSVTLNDNGFIKSVVLKDETEVTGDLFIDCSGLRGLLIEKTLKTGYEDWSYWLPMNSAIALQTESAGEPASFTKTTALEAGWQWRIPLQHRIGNGYVYCDKFISDSEATKKLLASVDGKALTEPRIIKFTTGRRKKFWNKNCVALGLASGFLEPLESTSISLIQTGLSKLMMFFPDTEFNADDIDEANRMAEVEMLGIRDFLILHYKLSQRNDSPFWQHIKNISVPEALAQKIKVFKRRGHLINYEAESFTNSSWISMYSGFGIIPEMDDIKTSMLDSTILEKHLQQIKIAIAQTEIHALSHSQFIAKYCATDS
jgi:tryptophan 7-halogenase